MSVIKLANGLYFMYIGIAIIFFLALLVTLANKSRERVHTVLTVLLFLNLALHLFRQVAPSYASVFPARLSESTPYNICTVSTTFLPFIYLIKKHNILHDFAYLIGVSGGLCSVFYPYSVFDCPPFEFDTIRFYVGHIVLFAVPLVAAILGVYRPSLKSFWAVPILFLAWETVICLNELFLMGVGLVDGKFGNLLNAAFRNYGFAFGVRPDFEWLKKVFDPLVPEFFRTDAFNLNGGTPFYFPVLWLTGPAFVFLIPLYIILSSPFWLYTYFYNKRNAGKPDA